MKKEKERQALVALDLWYVKEVQKKNDLYDFIEEFKAYCEQVRNYLFSSSQIIYFRII